MLHVLYHVILKCAVCSFSIHVFPSVLFTEKEKPPKWKEGSDPVLGEGQRTTIEGTELKLVCSAKGVPRPDIMWLKDDEPFFPRTDKVLWKSVNFGLIEALWGLCPAKTDQHGKYFIL